MQNNGFLCYVITLVTYYLMCKYGGFLYSVSTCAIVVRLAIYEVTVEAFPEFLGYFGGKIRPLKTYGVIA